MNVRRTRILASLFGALVLQACGHQQPLAGTAASVSALALIGVNVIPMDRESVLRGQTVLVRDGRIAALGPAANIAIPPDAVRIEAQGRFLLPGFTDAHVHLTSPTELPLYLANGVTTVLNLHGAPAHLAWRRAVEEGRLVGPSIVTTGPAFAAQRTPEAARRLVAEQAAAGYDGVKIYNQVSREEYPALVDEARRRRLLLIGHVARAPGFDAALRAGQSIAHAEEFIYSYFNPREDGDDEHIVYDATRIPEAVRRARAAGVSVVATIAMFRDIIAQATAIEPYLRNPELNLLAPWVRARLEPDANRYQNRFGEDGVANLRKSYALQRELLRALDDAGVPILAGTDATAIGPVAGFSIHEELLELNAAGLTPYRALRAATANAATYLGRASTQGTVEVGKRADLVLLEANPLEDIRSTRQIAGVMKDGRWFDADTLARLVARIPARYGEELEEGVALVRDDPASAVRFLAERDPLGFLTGAILKRALNDGGALRLRTAMHGLLAHGAAEFVEEAVNELGYGLLAQARVAEAIEAFAANCEAFPRSANTHDSLADGYLKAGDRAAAARSYRKALEVDSGYPNAAAARKFLAEEGVGTR